MLGARGAVTTETLEKSVVRRLTAAEQPLFREHLLRLDADTRVDRFNGPTDDLIIEQYVDRCASSGAIIIGWFEDGVVRGAAELHKSEDLPGQGDGAFSVERDFRRKGVGSILLAQLLEAARERGYRSLRITTQPQNMAMQALVRKFRGKLSLDHGEMVGMIRLRKGPFRLIDRALLYWTGPKRA
jgi:GNAT superfamily N-acetyltransferase